MTEKPIQLGLAGLGTVGSGVYETLCRNHALLEARSKDSFQAQAHRRAQLGKAQGKPSFPGNC